MLAFLDDVLILGKTCRVPGTIQREWPEVKAKEVLTLPKRGRVPGQESKQ